MRIMRSNFIKVGLPYEIFHERKVKLHCIIFNMVCVSIIFVDKNVFTQMDDILIK